MPNYYQVDDANIEADDNRWLISYADFITLLFAFFVVMYAVSSVNEHKYRQLADALSTVFHHQHKATTPVTASNNIYIPLPLKPIPAASAIEAKTLGMDLAELSLDIEQKINTETEPQLVNLRKTQRGLEIELDSNVIFESGSADVLDTAQPLISALAHGLAHSNNLIQVEGHTDNVPIKTFQFPSNWELSAARASGIVRALIKSGINPQRLAAIGLSDELPIADNTTEAGRARNRRVLLIVRNEAIAAPVPTPEPAAVVAAPEPVSAPPALNLEPESATATAAAAEAALDKVKKAEILTIPAARGTIIQRRTESGGLIFSKPDK